MTNQKQVSIIVAGLLPSLGIGYKNKLPWRLRKELRYFKDVTAKSISPNIRNAVIMGRKTWDSIPVKFRPLDHRYNVVLTKQDVSQFEANEDVKFANDLDETLQELLNDDKIGKIFIIGGCEIYTKCLINGLVDNLLLTEIEVNNGVEFEMDTFLDRDYIFNNFTKADKNELQKFIGESIVLPDEKITEGEFTYEYTLYKRK